MEGNNLISRSHDGKVWGLYLNQNLCGDTIIMVYLRIPTFDRFKIHIHKP